MPIVFDSLVLASVLNELEGSITGAGARARIEKVTQPDPLEIVLRLYGPHTRGKLFISCDPHSARIHFTEAERENPPNPYQFCQLLRKYLEGGTIEAIANPLGFGERVVHFTIRGANDQIVTLVAEIMGRHSNIVLMDTKGMVLGAAKHISHDLNRFRETLPGRPYIDPPRQKLKRDPMKGHFPDGSPLADEAAAAQWLLDRYLGVSPLLARESVARAERPLTTTTLWTAFDSILDVVRANNWTPIVWRDEDGILAGAYPISLASVEQNRQHHLSHISKALDQAAKGQEQDQTFHHARTSLISAIHRAHRSRKVDLTSVEQGLAQSEKAEWLQQCGDLILANQAGIIKGNVSVTVDDYYAPQTDAGETVTRTIELDVTRDAGENAERYFRKARKARDSKEMLQQRHKELMEAISLLAEAETVTASAVDARQIAEIVSGIAAHLNPSDTVDPNADPDAAKQKPNPYEGHKIRVFRSVDGFEILVGENATSNDYLTTKIATGADIWLHVRAATSAHGVIRTNNRPGAVGPATIQQAAEIVAARSESKHASLIPVDYTLKKYVRKPRKSAPGAVFYQNEKTIYVSGIGG